jgi:formylglycine-generating enzyme required for sulfatase activity
LANSRASFPVSHLLTFSSDVIARPGQSRACGDQSILVTHLNPFLNPFFEPPCSREGPAMADTRQIVSWSLERKCAFRSGDEWYLPDRTRTQLAELQSVASARKDGRIAGGICVTAWTMGRDYDGESFDIPCSGFGIDERLARFGGLPAALSTCGACEANAKAGLGFDVAGCVGYFDARPDSEELDRHLWGVIRKHALEDELRAAFPVTTPLWYGFWINSPLRRLQAEFLKELLEAACDDDDRQDRHVQHFLNALEAAIRWELPLHVSLAPLGHTDFGIDTVFPHCPRCKANADVGRWKQSYPETPHTCQVCGHVFIPNEHHSSEPMHFNREADELHNQLGEAGYDEFLRAFLRQKGATAQQADEVIDNRKYGPLLRQIAAIRYRRQGTLQRLTSKRSQPTAATLPATLAVPLANHIDLEFVLVPAGTFLMGSSGTSDADRPNESPQHLVHIRQPFYMSRFPVTQAQWLAVMGKNPSMCTGDPQLPVDQVSWFDCQDFCERLCEKHKRIFLLPSEAEWEYACRAGTTTTYAFGDTLSPSQANFTPMAVQFGPPPADKQDQVRQLEAAAEADAAMLGMKPRARPKPVGSYEPNAWGLYDMHGNVEEWCEDVWHESYVGAPTDGSPWLDNEGRKPFCVTRGGWASATEFVCTSTSRRGIRADAGSRDKVDDETETPGLIQPFQWLLYIPYGLRVVCECP